MSEIQRKFDEISKKYDEQRKKFIPCFDDFYRVSVSMKQVGLNVASDPLMSLSYIGVKGALVLLVADDPGPHSSQTEQDTRAFGHFANIPVLDPATPQEAYELTKLAFELSHEFQWTVGSGLQRQVCRDYKTRQILQNKS